MLDLLLVEHVPPLLSRFRWPLLSYLYVKGKINAVWQCRKGATPSAIRCAFPQQHSTTNPGPFSWGGCHLERSVSKILFFFLTRKCANSLANETESHLTHFRNWGSGYTLIFHTVQQRSKQLTLWACTACRRGSYHIPFSIIYFQQMLKPAFVLCRYGEKNKKEKEIAVKQTCLCHICLIMCVGYLQTSDKSTKFLRINIAEYLKYGTARKQI